MIGEQIKANAADIEQWETYRFVMPPFSMNGGLARMKQLFGGDSGIDAMLRARYEISEVDEDYFAG